MILLLTGCSESKKLSTNQSEDNNQIKYKSKDITINENLLNEKINQLKKGLEIIGADKKLYSKSNSDIINNILEMAFNGDSIKFTIENSDYTIDELIKCKQAYEIYFLKNKLTTLNSIVYKIKK